MAKVFLRLYNREIESMIEGGQLDEAVAHCQYILKTFPMHVDTYRLLGKAFLEARRYADAADIFQRVLTAVPDDFISHVGMSIIRDDENKIDDAIWHMERAFEVQPSNSAIQGELRRLCGRRDGVEPSKIRLSRDALAYMYSQGELFEQAIAEIRSVLAENPNRPDLQVMLARAYYRSSQKVEAAEMAASLLKKYPYCLDALRILVDVLPGTARLENMQIYRQRLHNLDPYSAFTANSVFASDQVADSAVNLERLEYKPGLKTVSSKTDWASSHGIKLDDEKQAEANPPAWMQSAGTTENSTPSIPESSGASVAQTPAGKVESDLEWMRSAGWQESNQPTQVGSNDSAALSSDEPIAKADIPDWLKSLAPLGVTGEVAMESADISKPQSASAADAPDWLKSTPPTENIGEVHAETQLPVEPQQVNVEPQAQSTDDIPDWFKSMAPAKAVDEIHIEAPVQPDEHQQTPVESKPASYGGVPDWFKTLSPAKTVGEVPAETTHPPAEHQTENVDATPDWLKTLTPAEASGEVQVAANQSPVVPQLEDADAIPDRLSSMVPEENVGVPNVISPPVPMEQPVDKQPVSELPVSPEPPDQAEVEPIIPPVGTSSETTQPTGEVKPLNIGDDAFSWLESLAAKQGAKPEELLTNPQERSGEIPDWLRQAGDKPADVPIPTAEGPAHTKDEPIHIKDEKPSTESPVEIAAQPANSPVNGEDDTMAWLEQLTADQVTKPDEPLVGGVADPGKIPDWIQKEQNDQPAGHEPEGIIPATTEPAPAEEDISITSWLSKLNVDEVLEKKSSEIPVEAAPSASTDELPDWLKDLKKPVTSAETPKAENNLPEWLHHPSPSVAIEPVPSTPVIDSNQEPEQSAWVDENISLPGQTIPTMPEEWMPAETKANGIPDSLPPAESTPAGETAPLADSENEAEITPAEEVVPASAAVPIIEASPVMETIPPAGSIPNPVQVPVRAPTLNQNSILPHIPVQDKDTELLSSAQNALGQNSLDDAMKKYTKIIKKGRLLDEVIHDLREAIYRYPVDVIVWQTLGDAYMRANRLQDALDAYTKAEEMLR